MWQANFYQQYMQQHAAMTQWIMQLHWNIHHQNSNYSNQVQHAEPYCLQSTHYQHPYSAPQAPFQNSTVSATTCSDISVEGEEYDDDDYEDDDEVSCEYELNVDAILAMRAAKEELNKSTPEEIRSNKSSAKHSSDSESYVFVDSDKEEFELVELGSMRTLDRKFLRPSHLNMQEEMQMENKIMEHTYGHMSESITNLESMELDKFNDLFDLLQPPLWPVIPVRFK